MSREASRTSSQDGCPCLIKTSEGIHGDHPVTQQPRIVLLMAVIFTMSVVTQSFFGQPFCRKWEKTQQEINDMY